LISREQGPNVRGLEQRELHAIATRLRLKLDQATDQYDAVTDELRTMAAGKPDDFGQEQVWTLLRTIKIQDQLLKMHMGGEPLNV
jgi:hypothetical protein